MERLSCGKQGKGCTSEHEVGDGSIHLSIGKISQGLKVALICRGLAQSGEGRRHCLALAEFLQHLRRLPGVRTVLEPVRLEDPGGLRFCFALFLSTLGTFVKFTRGVFMIS